MLLTDWSSDGRRLLFQTRGDRTRDDIWVLPLENPRAATGQDFPPSIDLVARGILKLDPLVTHVLSLTEIQTALGMLESDEDQRMKIILEHR